MGRKSLGISSRRMNSRLNSIAIISANGCRIGLFDYNVITQLNHNANYERIYWIKKKYLPYVHFTQAHAMLRRSTHDNPVNLTIKCISNENIVLDNYGRMYQNQVYIAQFTQLPLSVTFSDSTFQYPVYTLTPDIYLPWNATVVDVLTSISYTHPRPARRLSASASCPITFESLTQSTVYWTPCGHAFSIAIAQALENDPRCPLCRAECTFSDCVSA